MKHPNLTEETKQERELGLHKKKQTFWLFVE